MNIAVSIATSNPAVGSLVQLYPDVETALSGIREFLSQVDAAEAASKQEEAADDQS